MPEIGPYSRASTLAKLDKRSREARLMAAMRRDLTRQLGGNLSAATEALVDRCCWLQLHLATMDRRAAESGALSERDGREYLAWCNSLARLLRQIEAMAPGNDRRVKARTLADKLRERAASAP